MCDSEVVDLTLEDGPIPSAGAAAQLDLADPVLVVGLAGEGAASLAARLADRPEPADTSSPSPCEITRHDDGANGVVYLALSTALSSSNAEMEKEKSDLALLQEQARKKAAEEKGKRVELLRRQAHVGQCAAPRRQR